MSTNLLASGGCDGAVRLWALAPLAEPSPAVHAACLCAVSAADVPRAAVFAVGLSGTTLLSAATHDGGAVRVWHVDEAEGAPARSQPATSLGSRLRLVSRLHRPRGGGGDANSSDVCCLAVGDGKVVGGGAGGPVPTLWQTTTTTTNESSSPPSCADD